MAGAHGHRVIRQSASRAGGDGDVLIGDVMGTLLELYGMADVAFVGGSFVPIGGHNPIEPALWRIPVLSGPLQFNFPDVMGELEEAGGLATVQDEAELAECLIGLLRDSEERDRRGAAGYAVVERNRGASERLLELLRAEISAAVLQ